jgi:hypothetical protein
LSEVEFAVVFRHFLGCLVGGIGEQADRVDVKGAAEALELADEQVAVVTGGSVVLFLAWAGEPAAGFAARCSRRLSGVDLDRRDPSPSGP